MKVPTYSWRLIAHSSVDKMKMDYVVSVNFLLRGDFFKRFQCINMTHEGEKARLSSLIPPEAGLLTVSHVLELG